MRALHGLAILDTPPEERFDRITRLAKHLFRVEMALVSLVDKDRQWFKSRQGLSITQTCRTQSFCAYAIQGAGMLEVEDASQDARFKDNVSVTAPGGVRFYAGVPLSTSDGYYVGTLCIVDSQPRQLSDHERRSLLDLAACAEEEIKRAALEREIVSASKVRQRLTHQESQQRELVAALASLNEISASSQLALSQQLTAALELGCRYLDASIGIVSRIDNDIYEVVAAVSPDDKPIEKGNCLPLANTYCEMTLKSKGLLAIHHAGKGRARYHPCYVTFEIESYIGSVIQVSGEPFGTISFSSHACRDEAFPETDKTFVRLLTRWVGDALERERVEKLKSEFVATVSHELRTPLTSIAGALKLVVAGAVGPIEGQVHQMLTIALRNSDRLSMLINDLLDIEKLRVGLLKVASSSQSLSSLLKASIQENHSYALQCNVDLNLKLSNKDWQVCVDPIRFQQIMANLLSNAAKFSHAGDSVIVECEKHDNDIRVNVKDSGCGVPDRFKAVIFQQFSQANASDNRVKGGTGLGLTISKALTEQMGGSIGFSSKEGVGSIFYIQFPWLKEQDVENP
ncbi:MAG: GAF domain-containing protein [Halomonas sp.]|nr:MAG: GAF domain-containing protein [Halomonas sp.]